MKNAESPTQSIYEVTRNQARVLVDTMVILESHRVGSWRALTSRYKVETVEDCVIETQTGFQRHQMIDAKELRESLSAIHSVDDGERADLTMRMSDNLELHIGEESLWAHAVRRNDDWVFCGPDRASLSFGVQMGFRWNLVSLERLLIDIGHRPRIALRPAYTDKWLKSTLAKLAIA